jgi:trimethylamine corrinoid protein
MLAIPKAIKMLKEDNPGTKIIVGGAPLNEKIAKSYGADGYADNAGLAVKEAERILSV